MTSLILRTATRALEPLLLLYSLYLLVSGHDEPGGGFSGGLVASSAFALHLMAYDAASTRRMLRASPQAFIGVGLLLAVASGVWGVVLSKPFMTGFWIDLSVPGIGKVPLGTPLFFDLGVYVVVIGVTMIILLSLSED